MTVHGSAVIMCACRHAGPSVSVAKVTTSFRISTREQTFPHWPHERTVKEHWQHTCTCLLSLSLGKNALKLQQGKERCLESDRIEKRLMRSQSSELNEVHQQESHQNSQDVTPLQGDSRAANEVEGCNEPIQPKPALERRNSGDKLRVKRPGASEKKQWGH